jgi:hypothetical protein
MTLLANYLASRINWGIKGSEYLISKRLRPPITAPIFITHLALNSFFNLAFKSIIAKHPILGYVKPYFLNHRCWIDFIE